MKTKNKRIHILTDMEIDSLYSLPQFTEIERINYFSLNDVEQVTISELIYTHSKVHLILQLGYFKAKHRLFKFSFKLTSVDVEYVMQRYFSSQEIPDSEPSRNIQAENNKRVLSVLNYSNSNKLIFELLTNRAEYLVRGLSKPIVILRELLIYLEQKRMAIPEYSVFQKIVGKALSSEENRLYDIISRKVPALVQDLLDKLLTTNDISYEITALKQDPKNFNFKQIQQEVYKHKTYYQLYIFTKAFLLELNISRQNIEYYASLTSHYDSYRLGKFKRVKIYLYLLCYVNYRFQKMNDHLIQSFIHYVELYTQEAKMYAEKKSADLYGEMHKYLKSAGELLNMYADEKLSKLLFHKIQKKAFAILPKDQLLLVSNYMIEQCIDKEVHVWDFHAKNYQAIIKNLRQVFMVIEFNAHENDEELLNGSKWIKSVYQKGKSLQDNFQEDFPINYIPNRLKKYIYGTRIIKSRGKEKEIRCVNPYKYEFMVYSELKKHLSSNVVFSNDTIQYKSFDADISVVQNWKKDKEVILKKLDCQKICDPIESRLNTLENTLEGLILDVNNRIKSNENKYIKFKGKKDSPTWTLPYVKKGGEFNNPFYDQMLQINIIDLFDLVDYHCNFMKEFTHAKPYGSVDNKNYPCIKGCVIANATGFGIYKMADNSNLSYHSLASTHKKYIRLETLINASNEIINKISELPIFNHYNLEANICHASNDGQKYQTRRETFKSRYSTKYFGVEKGVVSLTTILNHVPVNTEMIGSNEYEGHYLFDMLFNNSSGLEPNRVSTDTHGTNNLNFVLLDLLNIEFAPCYKTITKKSKQLYGFKNIKEYQDFVIQPSHKVNKKLIVEEWPNIQPILAALMTKETTQSVVVKKLCSYERKNKTKEALWEYNNILMSIYLLKYIDDVELRQFVRAALNRGEAYHQLHATISGISGKRFRGSSDLEIEIWNECARLVANVILFYNAYILSKLMVKKEKEENFSAAVFIRGLSIAATQHINLNGRYEFETGTTIIDIDKIVMHLDKILGNTH